jgi:hypothetical protein
MEEIPNRASQSVVSAALSSFSATSDQPDATELQQSRRTCNVPEDDATDDNDAEDDRPETAALSTRWLPTFWRNHITVTVPGEGMRDHLGKQPLRINGFFTCVFP